MPLHAFLNEREPIRVGRRRFVVIPNMDMHQRGAGLEGFVG
jgi:hypothetical protein